MRILIVDDDNNKIINIINCLKEITNSIDVDTEIDGLGALKAITNCKYDLVILDVNLPINLSSSPSCDGGMYVLREILRRKNIKVPNYLIALSQYENLKNNFSSIWPFIIYDPTNELWKLQIKEICTYVGKAKESFFDSIYLKEKSVFVEGPTDEYYIREALKVFFTGTESIKIKHSSKTGASGVVRNILVWAFTLSRDGAGNYIKALGILDGDPKGIESTKEIRTKISNDSAESKTFKLINLNSKYTPHLVPLFQAGIKLPITIEELFPHKYWLYAEENQWLQERQNLDQFINTGKWNKYESSLKQFFENLNIDPQLKIYLKKIKDEKKEDFLKYIRSLDEGEKICAFQNFNLLINDIRTCLDC
jgi:CheY-like chemotaxis protein